MKQLLSKNSHSQKKQSQLTFHLTGFGQFQGVIDNPTTTLMQDLPEYLRRFPLSTQPKAITFEVVETSGKAVKEFFEKHAAQCVPHTIFVHFGVNSGAKQIALERTGWNNADFRCCDERKWQPCCEPIHNTISYTEHCFQTSFPLASVHQDLKQNGCQVEISDDPGRFVCNYIYYNSLLFSQTNATRCLFVHVPEFSVITREDQMFFARALLERLTEACDSA